MRPTLPPKKLPIDMMRIETAKGSWGIFVRHIGETQGGRNILIKIILEQGIDDEHFRMRNLEMVVNSRDARDSAHAADIASGISQWVESTEGDGFIEMTDLSRS
jgi:hypothetical protein